MVCGTGTKRTAARKRTAAVSEPQFIQRREEFGDSARHGSKLVCGRPHMSLQSRRLARARPP